MTVAKWKQPEPGGKKGSTTMKRTLLLLMDSGHFKAYRMEESPQFSSPRMQLLEEWDTAAAGRISDQVTDKAGQFSKGSLSFAAVNDMADGERHNLELEQRRRALKQIARRAGELLHLENPDRCYLAAAREMNQALLDSLDAPVRAKIRKNVAANLTRLNLPDIIEHFRSVE
jgi:hypothetical protein